MTDYYLKDVHSVLTRQQAEGIIASLPFAIYRKMGFQHQALELELEPSGVEEGVVWPAPYPLTTEEHKALESKRALEVFLALTEPKDVIVDEGIAVETFGELPIYDPKSPLLADGPEVLINTASLGEVEAGTIRSTHPDGTVTEFDANKGEFRFFDTPGHHKLDETRATAIADIKFRGEALIEIIESYRKSSPLPDCSNPDRPIMHFADDPNVRMLENALDRAQEAIMWAVRYVSQP